MLSLPIVLMSLTASDALMPPQGAGNSRDAGNARATPPLSAAASLLAALRNTLPQGYDVAGDHDSVVISWDQTTSECCAIGSPANTVLRRMLDLKFVAPVVPHLHERLYRENEKTLSKLRRLQTKMRMFSGRDFASSHYTYEPRNASERDLVRRCRKLLSALKPLPGYKLDDRVGVIIRGDLPAAEVLQQILTLLSPYRTTNVSEGQALVFANFWHMQDVSPLDDPRDCNPNADYSQTRILARVDTK